MTPPRVTYRASLKLHGSFDPEEITRRVGLQPTKTWRQGDPVIVHPEHGESRNRHSSDGWKVTAQERADDHDLDDACRRLLDLVEPARERILALGPTIERELSFVVYSPGRDAILGISSESLRRCAALQCTLNIDYYSLSES